MIDVTLENLCDLQLVIRFDKTTRRSTFATIFESSTRFLYKAKSTKLIALKKSMKQIHLMFCSNPTHASVLVTLWKISEK